ncbi:CD276 antigen homolog isoform X2 [Dicentrarchus labrax]|uniref:CD276 antigen homolog isoform X2 n=1 Tax=Dicentrarchus labrax TaxID=13489 RepID=UPI0021F59CCE|nr:CD276 antigen homolog isoform X2 [Dicentrarchus labrax]
MFTVAFFVLLVSDVTVGLDVNTAAGESALLPCTLTTTAPIDLKDLRFYWQDERNRVLFSYNKGKEVPDHVDKLYRDRITAFPQEMTTGNISVKIKNPTLEDDRRVFQVVAAVFDSRGSRRYNPEHRQLCKHTLHVAVPYTNVSLALNEETMTAVCTTQGFPEPLVKWRLQYLSNNSQHVPDPRDVHTTAVQDNQDHQYRLKSAVDIPEGRYRSVTCLFHNPILNVTVSTTHVLNRGDPKRSLPLWPVGLMAILVLSAVQ